MNDKIHAMIERHEGRRNKLYKDNATPPKWTIGVGWNIEDNGLPDHVIDILLDYSIALAQKDAMSFKWFDQLDDARKDVIVDMLFNLGLKRFGGFKKFIAAMESHNFEVAADEMFHSQWHGQVGPRAGELINMMLVGDYLTEDEIKLIHQNYTKK